MKLLIKKIGMTVAIVAALVFVGTGANLLVGGDSMVSAANTDEVCSGIDAIFGTGSCGSNKVAPNNVWAMAKTVINWILTAAGIVAVGFIIWAGIRYITSGGDAERVKKAKNTILYAVVGLLIAALALVIVNLVISVGTEATAVPSDFSTQADCTAHGFKWDGGSGKCVSQ